ncbi:MAG TPA: hypothetical protein VEG40_10825 [Gaiellaceae bacterium]|nr:hypothetical protein [Gaiellaceae bacterium]
MRSFGAAVALAFVFTGSAQAELVARHVQDGMLALGRDGTPYVAFVRGSSLEVTERTGSGRWRTSKVASVSPGSVLVDFATGRAGPVALVERADARTLLLARASGPGWVSSRLVSRLPAGVSLGWPGLILDRRGLPVVAYTRWHQASRKSTLYLAQADSAGRLRSAPLTSEGYPRSYVAPPAVPLVSHGELHVIESYGIDGAVGTIEWYPHRRTWTGQFLDGGIGDYPVGRLLATVGRGGTVYAAWCEALLGIGEFPVTVAVHGHMISSTFVVNRALATALVAAASGPEVAVNEWRSAADLDVPGNGIDWAGEVVGHGRRIELDGWLAGLRRTPTGGRDLLLAGPSGLAWFRAPHPLAVRTTVDAVEQDNGSVLVSGRVRDLSGGKVLVYRERPGAPRTLVGSAQLGPDGSFSLADVPPMKPVFYRAVYRDPATAIPYAALLREPID